LVIPFGKHKDATVAEVLATDPFHADWLLAQAWFAERFAVLHAALLQRLECRHLIIGSFAGRGVSLSVMRQMFKTNGMLVSTLQGIEACIPAAREWVEQDA
jgi:hypothetical protein